MPDCLTVCGKEPLIYFFCLLLLAISLPCYLLWTMFITSIRCNIETTDSLAAVKGSAGNPWILWRLSSCPPSSRVLAVDPWSPIKVRPPWFGLVLEVQLNWLFITSHVTVFLSSCEWSCWGDHCHWGVNATRCFFCKGGLCQLFPDDITECYPLHLSVVLTLWRIGLYVQEMHINTAGHLLPFAYRGH